MKVLLAEHSPFMSIAKQLKARGNELVTMTPQFAQMLNNLDLQARSLATFLNPDRQMQAFRHAAHLIHLAGEKEFPPNGLRPGVTSWLNENLPAYLYPRLSDLAGFVLAIDSCQPDLILVHDDVMPLTRAAAAWGQAKGVPVLHVPHAVYIDNQDRPGGDIHDVLTASHLAVGGVYQEKWYRDRGAREIALTGLPQFDPWALLAPDRRRACHNLNLDSNRPVVTYASSWRQDTNLLGCHSGVEETYLKMLEVIKALPDIQFVIKLHPHAQSGSWHIEQAQRVEAECTITSHHLEVVLQASDLILAYGPSNVLLEGAFIPWLRLMSTFGYEDEEVTVVDGEGSAESITQAILGALGESPVDTRAFRSKYIGRADGRATDRIVELLEGLCH